MDSTSTLAPAETPALTTPARAATSTVATPALTIAPATAAPLLTIKPLPGPTSTAAPLPTYPLGPALTPVYRQTDIDLEADCFAPLADDGMGSVEDMVNGPFSGSAPDTYVLKVQVETTSLWTSVEVTGLETMTSNYAITLGDGEINVDVEGLKVYDLSRPEGKEYQ